LYVFKNIHKNIMNNKYNFKFDDNLNANYKQQDEEQNFVNTALNQEEQICELTQQVINQNKTNHRIKIFQIVFINLIFIIIIMFSIIMLKKLITLSKINPYSVFALCSFASISVVSIYYIIGSAIKAIFGDHSDNKGHLDIIKKHLDSINKSITKQ
jgi:hypothetical protein